MAKKELTQEELQEKCKAQEKKIADLKKEKEELIEKGQKDQQMIQNLIADKEKLEEQHESELNSVIELKDQLDMYGGPVHFIVPAYLPQIDLIYDSITTQFRGESQITIVDSSEDNFTEVLQKVIDAEEISEQFVFVHSPCVAINPFSIEDLKTVKVTQLGSYNTGLPVVLEKSKIITADVELSEFLKMYFLTNFENEVPLILSLEKDNLRCDVWRENPRMHIVENALKTKKFYCFNEDGFKALEPIVKELYSGE